LIHGTLSTNILNTMEILILVGGCYALYTVGMAIATTIDYNSINKKRNGKN